MRTFALASVLALVAIAPAQETRRAFLGVNLDVTGLSEETRAEYGIPADVKSGVILAQVVEETPAAKAGLRRGDVVVEFDGKAIRSADQLVEAVRAHKPGDKVSYTVRRGPGTIHGILTLGEWSGPVIEEEG